MLIEFKKLILVVGAGLVEKFFLFLGLPLAFAKLKVLISGFLAGLGGLFVAEKAVIA